MRSSTLSPTAAAIRRVLFWTAMLTGVLLVGLQFACDRPQTKPVAAAFPHASRWPVQQGGSLGSAEATPTELATWGAPSRSSQRPPVTSLANERSAKNIHQEGQAWVRTVPLSTDKPPTEPFVEPAQ
jgi:hypothetical protein